MARFRQLIAFATLILFCSSVYGITTNGNGQVISTIKPAGGGDFTTLQSWYDTWAKLQTNPAQWAECYAGGSGLGTFVPTVPVPASNTPTATSFMRIYVPQAERFDAIGTGGAFVLCSAATGILIGNSVAYTRFEGLKFVLSGSGQVVAGAGAGNLFDSIWVSRLTDNNGGVNQCFSCNFSTNPYPAYVVLRNIVYQGNGLKASSQYLETLQAGIIRIQNQSVSNAIPTYGTAVVQNVTIDGVATNWSSVSCSATRLLGSPTGAYITVYMDNVVETRHADTNHVFVATNLRTNNPLCTLTVYQNNCFTTDSTATNWYVYAGTARGTDVPGVTIVTSNSVGNMAFSDCFTTAGFPQINMYNSRLLNAGSTNATAVAQALFPDYDFSKDAFGNPRIFGPAIDVGAMELQYNLLPMRLSSGEGSFVMFPDGRVVYIMR